MKTPRDIAERILNAHDPRNEDAYILAQAYLNLFKDYCQLSDDASTRDMIDSNIELTHKMTEEAVRRVSKLLGDWPLDRGAFETIKEVLKALRQFHPMYGESWCGWPKESD